MKIQIHEKESLEEIEITINCKQMNQEVEKVLAMLRILDMKLTGIKDKETYILVASKILYIDTVDKKTFFYTKDAVYETPLKLYELEELLASSDFLRVSKSCIINFNQIKALRPDLGGRLLVTMNNDEKLMISRQYAQSIKQKLGVK